MVVHPTNTSDISEPPAPTQCQAFFQAKKTYLWFVGWATTTSRSQRSATGIFSILHGLLSELSELALRKMVQNSSAWFPRRPVDVRGRGQMGLPALEMVCFWGMDSMDGWQRLWYMGVQQRIINQQKWDWTHQKVLIQSSKVGMLQNNPRKTISKRWTSDFARFTSGYLRISLPFCSSFFMIKIPNILVI